MSRNEQQANLLALLKRQRWAALATLSSDNNPEASMVAYALSRNADEIYLHLSELATHSRNLMRHPRLSLVISETDTGDGDPQQLARATVYGQAEILPPGQTGYSAARACYLAHLPTAEQLFDFGDFHLFRLKIERLRFVGGFGQAFNIAPPLPGRD